MLGESSDSTDGTLSVTVGNNGNTMKLKSRSEISRSFNLDTQNKSRMDNFCPIQKKCSVSSNENEHKRLARNLLKQGCLL